jgi:hypothetical protein
MQNEWVKKSLCQDMNGHLFLDMKDCHGAEYRDGDIVRVDCKKVEALGFIRYIFGRFEVVAPFKDQRFIFGLNPSYLICGHMATATGRMLIEDQESRKHGE